MRGLGVRFGAYNIYVPQLLKPAPSGLLAILWALKNDSVESTAVTELTQLASSGRTSVPVDAAVPRPLYRIVGYRIAGTRAVRVDILERLADLIRPLIAWRATPEQSVPPDGAAPGNGFMVTVSMTSLLGCSGEDFASVLRSLGYRVERKPVPPKPVEPAPADEPAAPPAESAAAPDHPAAEPQATTMILSMLRRMASSMRSSSSWRWPSSSVRPSRVSATACGWSWISLSMKES